MRLLNRHQLKTEKGIRWSRQYLDDRIKAGEFPAPIKKHRPTDWNQWVEDEIDDYIARRAAAPRPKLKPSRRRSRPRKTAPAAAEASA
jgi:predicted DNA-binding transcriptional regulator AlpA